MGATRATVVRAPLRARCAVRNKLLVEIGRAGSGVSYAGRWPLSVQEVYRGVDGCGARVDRCSV